jgi:Cd(II)/Pb(II)-responsive transcriptional regulator
MKISELGHAAGCDVQTIRYYEREGLLSEPARTDSGYRDYGPEHLARLQFIRHCRALDIPLSEVRQLLDYARSPKESCQATNDLLDAHIERVNERIRSLQHLRRELTALRSCCDGGRDKPCAILASFEATQS